MSDLVKAFFFAGGSVLSFAIAVVVDVRAVAKNPESSFAVPLTFISSGLVCAGVGVLLLTDYILR